jgi:hypothetical protein
MSDVNEAAEQLDESFARETATAQAMEQQAEATGEEQVAKAAGEKRRDQLKRKAEKLMSDANKIIADLGDDGPVRVDPSKHKVENEVRAALNEFNEVYVSNRDENYKYAWVYRDPHNEFGGRFVRRLQALGWEVVSGSREDAKKGVNPEAIEHFYVDGTRVVADCLLMRCRIDRYAMLEKRDRLLRQAQQVGIYSDVFEAAERAGVRVWEDMPDFVSEGIRSQADTRRARALGQFHARNRNGSMDRMLRTGTVPGIPPRLATPGRTR